MMILLAVCTAGKTHVALTYPQGGEVFPAGEVVSITWFPTVPHDTENWDLLISFDSGSTWDTLLANFHVDSLSYSWTTPDSMSTTVQIQVIQDNVGTDYTDESEDFSIALEVATIWSGISDSNWENILNWNQGLPTSHTPIDIPQGSANHPIITATVLAEGKTIIIYQGMEFEVLSGGQLLISSWQE